jgi:hypothetical protein
MPAGPLRGGPRPFRLLLCFFPDVFDQNPVARTVSWDSLVGRLAAFPIRDDIADKRRLPCWAPVHFEGQATDASGVADLSCLVLDLDGGVEIDVALARCAPFTVAMHTSWSHQLNAPCFRLVLPLARPVPCSAWGEAWQVAVEALGLPVDRKCCNANRRYLLPARPSSAAAHRAEVRTTAVALDLVPGLADACASRESPQPVSRPVTVPRHRLERAARQRLATDPAARRRLADALGAVVRGAGRSERAEGILCLACRRPSAWFLIAPDRATRARCNHRNTCGWTGPVGDLWQGAA